MYVCMYLCIDGWMDGERDIYVYINIFGYIYIYIFILLYVYACATKVPAVLRHAPGHSAPGHFRAGPLQTAVRV